MQLRFEGNQDILYEATDGDYAFAMKQHVDFANEVVATIPRSGGIIRSESIRAWITTRAEENDGTDTA